MSTAGARRVGEPGEDREVAPVPAVEHDRVVVVAARRSPARAGSPPGESRPAAAGPAARRAARPAHGEARRRRRAGRARHSSPGAQKVRLVAGRAGRPRGGPAVPLDPGHHVEQARAARPAASRLARPTPGPRPPAHLGAAAARPRSGCAGPGRARRSSQAGLSSGRARTTRSRRAAGSRVRLLADHRERHPAEHLDGRADPAHRASASSAGWANRHRLCTHSTAWCRRTALVARASAGRDGAGQPVERPQSTGLSAVAAADRRACGAAGRGRRPPRPSARRPAPRGWGRGAAPSRPRRAPAWPGARSACRAASAGTSPGCAAAPRR